MFGGMSRGKQKSNNEQNGATFKTGVAVHKKKKKKKKKKNPEGAPGGTYNKRGLPFNGETKRYERKPMRLL